MSFAYSYEIEQSDGPITYKTIKGILSIDDEELLFEYKLYDQTLTSISALNKYSINVDLLKSIRFKKTLFSAYVIIESDRTVFLDPLPGSSKGIIHLQIDRDHRKQAEDFCTQINVAMERRREK